MTSFYKFEEISENTKKAGEEEQEGEKEHDSEEAYLIGGAPLQFDKDAADMPIKRFENLVVPLGLHIYNYNMVGGSVAYDMGSEENGIINEAMFSKLFYSVARDLGSYSGKSRTSITKKNRP
jgi:hypothetical protein